MAAPTVAPPTVGDATVGSPGGVGTDQANVVGAVADASIPTATTFGPPPTNPAEVDARAAAMEAEGRRQRGVDTAANANVPGFQQQGTPQGMPMDTRQSAAPSTDMARVQIEYDTPDRGPAQLQPQGSISIDGGVDMLGNPLAPPDPNRMAVRGGGGEGERSVFSDEFGGGPMTQQQQIEAQIGLAASDPSSAAVAQQQIPGGQPPAGGEQFTPASLSAMDTASAAVGDILTADPTARTTVDGASVLNRPEGEGIEAYMNAAGVDAQIEAAQREADRITSERQGRQAQAGAFGSTSSRAALEDIEAAGQEARMIADIRRQGFDSAAARMDADVARQQQARLAEAEIQSQETQAERDARLRAAQIGTNIGSTIGQEERAIGTSIMDMGKDQEAIANQQRAEEYEQWLRQQEGGGRELELLKRMMPEGDTERTAQGRSKFETALATAGTVGSTALTLAELLGGGGMTPEEIENERLKKLLAGGTPQRRTAPRRLPNRVPDAVTLPNLPSFDPRGSGGPR